MVCVRENTEGEYAGAGGRVHVGMEHEVGIQVDVFTRLGVERVVRHAFELARSRRGRLASITKSNASPHHFVMWDEIVAVVHADFPGVELDRILVDAACAYMITQPQRFDVMVASNLFGDIITDIGAAIQGGMGLAASANISPAGTGPGLFEPVHGSAPDIAGRSRANPIGAVWAGAMMLDHLGEARVRCTGDDGDRRRPGRDRRAHARPRRGREHSRARRRAGARGHRLESVTAGGSAASTVSTSSSASSASALGDSRGARANTSPAARWKPSGRPAAACVAAISSISPTQRQPLAVADPGCGEAQPDALAAARPTECRAQRVAFGQAVGGLVAQLVGEEHPDRGQHVPVGRGRESHSDDVLGVARRA